MHFLILCVAILLSCNAESQPINPDSIPLSYLALGDSYTIGQGVPEEDRFPVQLMNATFSKPHRTENFKIIARTGWTTSNLLAAMEEEDLKPGEYDMITLLIGVNNQYQGKPFALYEEELEELIDQSIALLNGDAKRLILVSIPDYSVTPFAGNSNTQKIAQEIMEYNNYKEELAQEKGCHYVYITDLTQNAKDDPTLIASDQLHPSGKSYGQWLERIIPIVEANIINR